MAFCNLLGVPIEHFALRMGTSMTYYIVRGEKQKQTGKGGYFASASLEKAISKAQHLASHLKRRMYVQVWKPAGSMKRYVLKQPIK